MTMRVSNVGNTSIEKTPTLSMALSRAANKEPTHGNLVDRSTFYPLAESASVKRDADAQNATKEVVSNAPIERPVL